MRLCANCGKWAERGRTLCRGHLRKNRERIRLRDRKRRGKCCVRCGGKLGVGRKGPSVKFCQKHLDEEMLYQRRRYSKSGLKTDKVWKTCVRKGCVLPVGRGKYMYCERHSEMVRRGRELWAPFLGAAERVTGLKGDQGLWDDVIEKFADNERRRKSSGRV